MNRLLFVCVLCVLAPSTVLAQTRGFPLADTAAPKEQNRMHALAGGTCVDEGYAIGARYAYDVFDGWRAFLGAGAVLPDDADDVLGVQLGTLYSIPYALPVDLGVRGVLYFVDEYQTTRNAVEEWGFNLMLVSSGVFDDFDPALEGYFGLGFNIADIDQSAQNEFGEDKSDTETEPVVVGGLQYRLTEQVSVYGELGYLEKVAAGFGLRVDF